MGLPLNNHKRPFSNIDKIAYISTSFYNCDLDFENVSDDGAVKIKVRPSKLKIVMKADKVKKIKKTPLQNCLNSFRMVDFTRNPKFM